MRQLVFHESVAARFVDLVDTRRQYRVVGRRKRQFVDHHQRQRFTFHIYTFPEALAAEQHGVA